ncbi:MAG TPA: signal recognition particle-docking protein FtsY [Aestuariivirga sp.]|nr:signal recognition particle-docking protein FtsY [Aestuariivirga sp.]
MSGFFKKLFNRIAGKTENVTPPIENAKALRAPEPEFLPEPEPAPVADEPEFFVEASETVTPAQPEVKPERTPQAKGELKRAEVKKLIPKKPKPKAPAPKKVEPKLERPVESPPESIAVSPFVPELAVSVPIIPESPADEIPEAAPASLVYASPERKGWLTRLKGGLSKSSKSITGSITAIFTKRRLDAGTLGELEDVLVQADLGLAMAERIVRAVAAGRYDKEIEPEEVKRILAEEVAKVLKPVEVPFNFGAEKPFVILVVGVNGSGKTTTIGKLGAIAANEGFKLMFAACDTFRAAAIEQLTIWGQRVGAKTISRPTGADSSGLVFDAMTEARETGTDILFIDTAGRLQNKAYLMDELDKVVRVVKKQDATAPHAVLLVLDATTGQNAMAQAEVFTKVAGVTGLIMTKLDGTARGGILVAIAEKFKLPVHAVGIGEQIDDLQPFEAEAFARAIAGLEDR